MKTNAIIIIAIVAGAGLLIVFALSFFVIPIIRRRMYVKRRKAPQRGDTEAFLKAGENAQHHSRTPSREPLVLDQLTQWPQRDSTYSYSQRGSVVVDTSYQPVNQVDDSSYQDPLGHARSSSYGHVAPAPITPSSRNPYVAGPHREESSTGHPTSLVPQRPSSMVLERSRRISESQQYKATLPPALRTSVAMPQRAEIHEPPYSHSLVASPHSSPPSLPFTRLPDRLVESPPPMSPPLPGPRQTGSPSRRVLPSPPIMTSPRSTPLPINPSPPPAGPYAKPQLAIDTHPEEPSSHQPQFIVQSPSSDGTGRLPAHQRGTDDTMYSQLSAAYSTTSPSFLPHHHQNEPTNSSPTIQYSSPQQTYSTFTNEYTTPRPSSQSSRPPAYSTDSTGSPIPPTTAEFLDSHRHPDHILPLDDPQTPTSDLQRTDTRAIAAMLRSRNQRAQNQFEGFSRTDSTVSKIERDDSIRQPAKQNTNMLYEAPQPTSGATRRGFAPNSRT